MASTDSTIPDTATGDSVGGNAGQSFTEKAKSALKGNIPVDGLPPHSYVRANRNTDRRQGHRAERFERSEGKDGSGRRQRHWVQFYTKHAGVGSRIDDNGTGEVEGEDKVERKPLLLLRVKFMICSCEDQYRMSIRIPRPSQVLPFDFSNKAICGMPIQLYATSLSKCLQQR